MAFENTEQKRPKDEAILVAIEVSWVMLPMPSVAALWVRAAGEPR